MAKRNTKVAQPREVFRIPEDATRVLAEISYKARLTTGAKIPKTRIITELLKLLKQSKVNVKRVHSVDDVIDQLKEHIRKAK
jgi:hypothetical protein